MTYTLNQIISDLRNNPRQQFCLCCGEQFCTKQSIGKKLNMETSKKWENVLKTKECPQCGVIKHNIFWLREDGIECCQCR